MGVKRRRSGRVGGRREEGEGRGRKETGTSYNLYGSQDRRGRKDGRKKRRGVDKHV